MLQPGQLFERKYVVRERLASDAFSESFRAEQGDSGRVVVIRVLRAPTEVGLDPEAFRKRFQREAQLCGHLQSPHNVRVVDFGELAGGRAFVASELVSGASVARLIGEGGALPPARVVRLVDQCLIALGEAHDLGLMHRDVRPENVVISDGDGRADHTRLMNLGIARPYAEQQSAARLGAPRYMAPEQLTVGARVGTRADLHSLGLVAYEMLTGRPPFDGVPDAEVIARKVAGEPLALPPDLPISATLRSVVEQMLAFDPDDRPSTASEARSMLQAWSAGEPAPATLVAPTNAFEHVPQNNDTAAVPRSVDRADILERSRTRRVVAMAVVGLAVMIGMASAAWRARSAIASRNPRAAVRMIFSEPSQCVDDEFEPNDRSLDGPQLTRKGLTGRVCPNNSDWFLVGKRAPGDVVQVRAEYGVGEDDIDMEIFVDSTFIKGVYTAQPMEELTHELTAPGLVAVRLFFSKARTDDGRTYHVRVMR